MNQNAQYIIDFDQNPFILEPKQKKNITFTFYFFEKPSQTIKEQIKVSNGTDNYFFNISIQNDKKETLVKELSSISEEQDVSENNSSQINTFEQKEQKDDYKSGFLQLFQHIDNLLKIQDKSDFLKCLNDKENYVQFQDSYILQFFQHYCKILDITNEEQTIRIKKMKEYLNCLNVQQESLENDLNDALDREKNLILEQKKMQKSFIKQSNSQIKIEQDPKDQLRIESLQKKLNEKNKEIQQKDYELTAFEEIKKQYENNISKINAKIQVYKEECISKDKLLILQQEKFQKQEENLTQKLEKRQGKIKAQQITMKEFQKRLQQYFFVVENIQTKFKEKFAKINKTIKTKLKISSNKIVQNLQSIATILRENTQKTNFKNRQIEYYEKEIDRQNNIKKKYKIQTMDYIKQNEKLQKITYKYKANIFSENLQQKNQFEQMQYMQNKNLEQEKEIIKLHRQLNQFKYKDLQKNQTKQSNQDEIQILKSKNQRIFQELENLFQEIELFKNERDLLIEKYQLNKKETSKFQTEKNELENQLVIIIQQQNKQKQQFSKLRQDNENLYKDLISEKQQNDKLSQKIIKIIQLANKRIQKIQLYINDHLYINFQQKFKQQILQLSGYLKTKELKQQKLEKRRLKLQQKCVRIQQSFQENQNFYRQKQQFLKQQFLSLLTQNGCSEIVIQKFEENFEGFIKQSNLKYDLIEAKKANKKTETKLYNTKEKNQQKFKILQNQILEQLVEIKESIFKRNEINKKQRNQFKEFMQIIKQNFWKQNKKAPSDIKDCLECVANAQQVKDQNKIIQNLQNQLQKGLKNFKQEKLQLQNHQKVFEKLQISSKITIEKKYDDLNANYENIQSQYQEKCVQNDNIKQEKEKLQQKLNKQKRENIQKTTYIEQLKTKQKKLEDQIEQYIQGQENQVQNQKKIKNDEKYIQQILNNKKQLEELVDSLKKQLEQRQSTTQDNDNINNKYKQEIERKSQLIQQLKNKIKDVTKNREKQQEEEQSLKEQNLSNQIQRIQNSYTQMEQKNKILSFENQKLIEEIKLQKQKNAKNKNKIKNMVMILQALEEEIQYAKQILKISLKHLDIKRDEKNQETQKNDHFINCLKSFPIEEGSKSVITTRTQKIENSTKTYQIPKLNEKNSKLILDQIIEKIDILQLIFKN